MKVTELDNITGTLSKPSKMPGWSYGIPAKECKTGSKLAKIPGTVCHGCYALKGCYVFPNVQEAQYKRLSCFETRSDMLKEFEEDVEHTVQWHYTSPSNFKDLKNGLCETDSAFITTNLGERQYYVFNL